MAYLYILYSPSMDSFYVGSTNNLVCRIQEHANGCTSTTRCARPWFLVFLHTVATLSAPRKLELRLKRFKNKRIINTIVHEQVLHMAHDT